MAALIGYVSSSGTGGYVNPYVSAGLTAHDTEVDLAATPGHSRAAMPPASSCTYTMPAAPVRAILGIKSNCYGDDYYHRIHVTPLTIDLGNVISTQVSQVRVWNAYLKPQRLIKIDGIDEGLELNGPQAIPFVLSALQETDWLLSVTPDGPSTLDSTLRWIFDGSVQSPRLRITGNRIVPWGFVPDWSNPVTEKLSWLTDILANSRGTEQRRSLRVAPRKSWSASFVAEGAERALFDLAMSGWGRRVWALPVWVDMQTLAVDLPVGSLFIACDTKGRDFRLGGLAILRGETAFDTEAVEIIGLDNAGLTIKRVTQAHWPAGTRLYPLRSARLVEMPETTRLTDRLLRAEASFELTEAADWPASLPATLYRGMPVFEARPDESKDLTHSYERLVLTLDNTTAMPAVTDTAGKNFALQQHRWMLAGREEHSAWRSLLYGLRGRAQAVWVPTHAEDLVPAELASGAVLKVQRVGYARFGLGQQGRRDIRIELHSGAVIYRRITAAVESGPTEELALDSSLPGVIAPEQIARISYMALCRLASDDIELEHLTDADGIARTAVNWRGVRDDLEAL
ncbi:hypothetical protein [Comamonas sp.]|uniref:hypothetical protein n=1 Tax=Comamonas sp. TaxID=34028 RepID=UPI002590A809|nr:hypothetical protein [Comamonas sp.]